MGYAMTSRTVRACLLASSAALIASAGLAQTAPPDPSPGGPAQDVSRSTAVGEVVVTAPREEVRARVRQENAPNIVNVQSAETIAKYPDFNAAESLGRIPGISITSDTGEGRFVSIRGIDPNLNGATYGGIVLLNTNPGGTSQGGGGRAVEFDTIPDGAIDGLIVTKTRTPEQEGEGIGGTIELTPRSAKNTAKPFVDLTLGYGVEPLHGHDDPFNADLAFGGRFGFSGSHLVLGNGTEVAAPVASGWISNPTPFAVVLTASTRQDRRGVDDIENDFLDNGPPVQNTVNTDYQLRRYDYHRRRFGFGGEFDFTPNDNHSYYVRAANAGYIESVHKNFLLLRNLDASVPRDDNGNPTGPSPTLPGDPNSFVTNAGSLRSTLTDEQETHRNQVYAIGGRDQFGGIALDYHVAYSRATFDVGRNINATFLGPQKAVGISYNNISDSNNIPVFKILNGVNVNDPTLYTLSGVNDSQEHDRDEEESAAVNLSIPTHFFNDEDRLKVGLEGRLRNKAVDPFNENFTVPPGISENGLSTAPNLDYYGGAFSNGPFIDRYGIRKLISTGVVTSAKGLTFTQDRSYLARENVYAGYGQYTAQIGKFGLLAGVRVEATDGKYGGFVNKTIPVLDANGNPTFDTQGNPVTTGTDNFQSRYQSYTNVFPTVELRYNFTPKLVGRVSWTTGVGRPGFQQNNNTASVDYSQTPVLINRGNPNLQPTLADNFDIDLEYYLPGGGIAELGFFDKEITNYIIQRINRNVFNDPFAPGQQATVTTYSNVPFAYVRGIEAAYNQKFTFLPGIFKGFGFEANAVYNDSQIQEYSAAQTLTGRAEYGLLPGTARFTGNGAIYYEAYKLQVRVAAQYVGHSLFGLSQSDKFFDTVLDDRLTLDFNSSYQFTPSLAGYFQVRNLTDEPLRYYEESSNKQIQREFYDVTIEGGVRLHF